MDFPSVKYPTVVSGYVQGPLRLESLDGTSLYLTDKDEWNLTDFGPLILNGKTYGVSHLQYKSPHGWLKMEPDSYHWWKMWKLQEPGKPGTEQGIYLRKSRKLFQLSCWRWQVPDANSNWQPWIFSKGYLGGHLD